MKKLIFLVFVIIFLQGCASHCGYVSYDYYIEEKGNRNVISGQGDEVFENYNPYKIGQIKNVIMESIRKEHGNYNSKINVYIKFMQELKK